MKKQTGENVVGWGWPAPFGVATVLEEMKTAVLVTSGAFPRRSEALEAVQSSPVPVRRLADIMK